MRKGTKCTPWTTEDKKILERLYPKGGVEAVFAALDGRHSRGSIRTTAYNWHVHCETPAWRLRRKRT